MRPGSQPRAFSPASPGPGPASVLLALVACAAALGEEPRSGAPDRPFGPGERVEFRISYAHLLAGRATLAVLPAEEGKTSLRFVAEARSQGFVPWLLRFHVDDRTIATFDPDGGYSLGIEKHLHEGRAARDQRVTFDPATGTAEVRDAKIAESRFDVGLRPLDVLSALFVARIRGVEEGRELRLPVFDNGKSYVMDVRWLGRERLDLPPPFGTGYPTVIVEPRLVEGSGLFVREGRVQVWLTDDGRRVPVRMRSKVPIGAVSADVERYEPPPPVKEAGVPRSPGPVEGGG
ncbi:MAG TPA: DUF3108 domain-containing protein [Vicinamibacteria bacterium]|nr:DUF3108 domain-containing protein [Vicinamibacteria bacterium]